MTPYSDGRTGGSIVESGRKRRDCGMTRHKTRGDVLVYDATRGCHGKLVGTGGATMDSCGGMIRTAGDSDNGLR